MANVNNNRRASVTITFDTPAGALGWFEQAQQRGLLQHEAALFIKDGLDDVVGSNGVPGANEFIVRRESDRPFGKVEFASQITDRVVVRAPAHAD